MPLFVPQKASRFVHYTSLNQAANANAAILSLAGLATGGTDGHRPGAAGTVREIHLQSNADLSAGTAIVEVYVDAVQTGILATLSDLVQHHEVIATTPFPYAANARITARITTDAAFAPVTIDITCQVLLVDS
jgi:hypothetical protein